MVSLALARGEVPVPVGLRLFLPEAWAADPGRCARAGVPEEHRRALLAKTDLALAGVDRVLAAGARFGAVLADAGDGVSAAFRRGLSARGLAWAVGVLKTQTVYPPTVALLWPRAATGRPRKHPVPSEESRSRLRPCWRTPPGAGSAGDWGPRGRSWPRSPPGGCARPRASTSATGNMRRATRSGWWAWWASAAPRARGSTTSPTCRPRPRSRGWRP